MENEILKLCGIALLASVVGLILSAVGSGIRVAVCVGGLVLVLGGGAVLLGRAVSELSALGFPYEVGEYLTLMLKGLGIAFLCRICSDVCRECGQASLASAVDSAGQICMVLIALPTVSKLLQSALEMIK